jgi:hypothetical protein
LPNEAQSLRRVTRAAGRHLPARLLGIGVGGLVDTGMFHGVLFNQEDQQPAGWRAQ